MRCSKQSLYSITSSARARKDSGMVSPSALAVLRLITSSTFVSSWTGRWAGFSPLRMRPEYTPTRRPAKRAPIGGIAEGIAEDHSPAADVGYGAGMSGR
jgi:hypothetical protein